MPIFQKIKIWCYIFIWFIFSCLTSYALFQVDLPLLLSVLVGFTPYTLIGIWIVYLFYPKFDPSCCIKCYDSKKLIALTFDDGPTMGFTEDILGILKDNSVKATFFMIGEKIEKNRSIALRVLKDGHDIGAHTYTHKKLHLSGSGQIAKEINSTVLMIKELYKEAGIETSYRPIFRSPHGFKNIRLNIYLKKHGLYLIPWTRGVWDTSSPGSEWIIEKAIKKPRNNEIILLHDGKGVNQSVSDSQRTGLLQALPKVIDFYKNKGYTFIKVFDFIR